METLVRAQQNIERAGYFGKHIGVSQPNNRDEKINDINFFITVQPPPPPHPLTNFTIKAPNVTTITNQFST